MIIPMNDYCDDDDNEPTSVVSDTPMLVDFVPRRSESCIGDASTIVAADPSEVISEVDDLAPEEQNYGPVVDHTPITQHPSPLVKLPSISGSTVVFAPQSVAADDFDDEDSATVSHGQKIEWETDDKELDAIESPPKLINDGGAVSSSDGQLVDFIPPVADHRSTDADDAAQEGFSIFTLGGAQSLLQTGEPREEDYGPVVDHTPYLQSVRHPTTQSLDSEGAQNGYAEDNDETDISTVGTIGTGSRSNTKSKVFVDPLPRMIRNNPIDSMVTEGRSESSDEEEDDTSTRFGPVVDLLPVSRASFAPSRGGSTVDALANVSEANSDEDEGDEEGVGWGEVDYDASIGGVSEGTGRFGLGSPRKIVSKPTRGIENERSTSVRFDSSVDRPDIFEEFGVATSGEGIGFGSNLDVSQPVTVDGGVIDSSFADADTPLSTPHRSTNADIRHTEFLTDHSSLMLPNINIVLEERENKLQEEILQLKRTNEVLSQQIKQSQDDCIGIQEDAQKRELVYKETVESLQLSLQEATKKVEELIFVTRDLARAVPGNGSSLPNSPQTDTIGAGTLRSEQTSCNPGSVLSSAPADLDIKIEELINQIGHLQTGLQSLPKSASN